MLSLVNTEFESVRGQLTRNRIIIILKLYFIVFHMERTAAQEFVLLTGKVSDSLYYSTQRNSRSLQSSDFPYNNTKKVLNMPYY